MVQKVNSHPAPGVIGAPSPLLSIFKRCNSMEWFVHFFRGPWLILFDFSMKGSQKVSNPLDFHIMSWLIIMNGVSSLDVCVHCSLRPTESPYNIMGLRFLRSHLIGVAKFSSSPDAGLIQTALSKVDNHEY